LENTSSPHARAVLTALLLIEEVGACRVLNPTPLNFSTAAVKAPLMHKSNALHKILNNKVFIG